MKHLLYGLMTAVYLWNVYFSLSMLPAMSEKLEERHPRLIDKRWKRVIWLGSSLLLIPYLVLAEPPAFVAEEVRWFLSGAKEGKGK
ncbi:MAG: hypothetical protein M0Z48_02380 [Nitrospiraceae bacterium]|nr:hypothetical protein [Nitrospiraceae bacterium]